MRVMMGVLILLLVLLQIGLWRQYGQIGDLRRQVAEQLERNGVLRERNDALAAEVADLKSGLEAVEERARAELGLVRDGERFYLVVDPDDLPEGQTEALRELETHRDQVMRLEDRVEDLAANEQVLQDTLTTAQKLSEDLKRTATKESEVLVREAEVKGEKILEAAQRREPSSARATNLPNDRANRLPSTSPESGSRARGWTFASTRWTLPPRPRNGMPAT